MVEENKGHKKYRHAYNIPGNDRVSGKFRQDRRVNGNFFNVADDPSICHRVGLDLRGFQVCDFLLQPVAEQSRLGSKGFHP